MINRNIPPYKLDLLIIGGGINGATAFYEAARRGLKVLLIEKDDFGSKSSAGCFKTIHGGVRYLQHLNIPRVLESVNEQRNLRIIAKHLTAPLPFIIPTYKNLKKGKLYLSTGLSAYELISFYKNIGIEEGYKLPRHKLLNIQDLLNIAPGVNQTSLTGGVCFYDAVINNIDRMNLAFIKDGIANGGTAVNYCESEKLISKNENIINCIIRDKVNNKNYTLETDHVLVAAGSWSDKIKAQILTQEGQQIYQDAPKYFFSKGIQLAFPNFIKDHAIMVESRHDGQGNVMKRGGRGYFFLPWNKATLAGTADSLFKEDPDSYMINENEVSYFMKEIKSAYQSDQLNEKNIWLKFGGLRRCLPSEHKRLKEIDSHIGTVESSHDDQFISSKKISNLHFIKGSKYTTARALSEKAIISIFKTHRLKAKTLSSTPSEDLLTFSKKINSLSKAPLEQSKITHLYKNYGIDALEIVKIYNENSEYSNYIESDNQTRRTDTTIGELIFAARNESVQTLEDLIFRRTTLGSLGISSEDVLMSASSFAAKELGWEEWRRLEYVKSIQLKL